MNIHFNENLCQSCPERNKDCLCEYKLNIKEKLDGLLPNYHFSHSCKIYKATFKRGDIVRFLIFHNKKVNDTWIWRPAFEVYGTITGRVFYKLFELELFNKINVIRKDELTDNEIIVEKTHYYKDAKSLTLVNSNINQQYRRVLTFEKKLPSVCLYFN